MNITEANNTARLIEYAAELSPATGGRVTGEQARKAAMELAPRVHKALMAGPDVDQIATAPWPDQIRAAIQLQRLLFDVWFDQSTSADAWAICQCRYCHAEIAPIDGNLPSNLAWLAQLIGDHLKSCTAALRVYGGEIPQ